MIPLVIFVVLSAMNRYYTSSIITFLSGLLLAFGLLSFFGLGFFCQKLLKNNFKPVLFVMLSCLAITVLVSFIANLVTYGPMYVVLHKGFIYFLDGAPYTVSSETKLFTWIGISEVHLGTGSIMALVLASSAFALLFISPRKQTYEFLFVAVTSGIGWLFLLFLPYTRAFILLIPALFLALVFRFLHPKKVAPRWEKNTALAVLGLATLALLLLFVNGITATVSADGAIKGNLFASVGFLNRIFNNGFTAPINETIYYVFHGGSTAGGFSLSSVLFGTSPQSLTTNTVMNDSFEFEALLEGGLLCFIALLALILLAIVSVRKWLLSDETISFSKMGIALLFMTAFVGMSFFYERVPFIYENWIFSPFRNNFTLLVMMFLLGLTYQPIFKTKPATAVVEGGKAQ